MRRALLPIALLAAALGGCIDTPPAVPTQPDTLRYSDPRRWLCLPGRDDTCARDLTATEIRADGTRAIEPREPVREAKLDCFYVYPTVDLDLLPGNHADFHDLEPIAGTTTAQAARFRDSCALYVPLYRQVTIGAYLHESTLEQRLAFAFSDVEASFREYLARYDRGRPIVLIGHSQGAEMIVRLVKRFFDDDPAMRARLVLAMAIGGEVEVPKGKVVGATFANVPLCTRVDETGCVIAYRSYEAGAPISAGRSEPSPGDETACVNPASIGENALRPLSRAYFPAGKRTRHYIHGVDAIETPFAELRDFYAAQCVDGADGYRYLAISLIGAPGDVRVNPIDFARMPFRKLLGLHLVDMQLPQGDLVDLVARHAAAIH